MKPPTGRAREPPARFPSLQAELGYAVARGRLSIAMADIAILARYPDLDEARQRAAEMRRCIAVWRHVRDQLRQRIHELTTANARAQLPWNAVMAQANEVNRSQTLDEREVTAIAEAAGAAEEERRQPIRKGGRIHA